MSVLSLITILYQENDVTIINFTSPRWGPEESLGKGSRRRCPPDCIYQALEFCSVAIAPDRLNDTVFNITQMAPFEKQVRQNLGNWKVWGGWKSNSPPGDA